ncbi:hypothetical protein A2U01_0047582, partial [Trifolium medium]|nr:hypothetical protein [Trifolium medium]
FRHGGAAVGDQPTRWSGHRCSWAPMNVLGVHDEHHEKEKRDRFERREGRERKKFVNEGFMRFWGIYTPIDPALRTSTTHPLIMAL